MVGAAVVVVVVALVLTSHTVPLVLLSTIMTASHPVTAVVNTLHRIFTAYI